MNEGHARNRREWMVGAAGLVGACVTSSAFAANVKRPRVAAIITSFTYRSHAHVIMENFLNQYLFNGEWTDPGVDVVSMYLDQHPAGDMGPGVAKEFGIPVFKTIGDAMRVGTKELAVDAALLIGEHGSYPTNKLGQRMYPRKRFFDDAVAVMKSANRFVPIFNDKHLSYRWDWAQEMYATAQKHKIPFLAGSSVPLAQRRPALELENGTEMTHAVSIHGGPVESYDFHGLEVLQSMVEHRKGGETGIESVEFLDRNALKKARAQGFWADELAREAMKAELGKTPKSLESVEGEPESSPHAILVNYKDGFKAAVLRIGRDSTRWNFACRVKDQSEIPATSFYVGPWENRNLFKALSHAIQTHFTQRKAPYPVERTLMVTGALDAVMRSRSKNKAIKTPDLMFAYQTRDYRAMREMGKTWEIITDKVPQPRGLDGRKR